MNRLRKPSVDEGSRESEAMYKTLVNIASKVPGDTGTLVPIQDIPWADESLIKHGLIFYSTHLTQFVFAATMTFMLGLALKPITGVVIKGEMGDPKNYFPRFLSTFKLIAEFFWLYFNPEKAYKTFAYVRKRHNLARKLSTKPSTKPIQPQEAGVFTEKWKKDLSFAVRADLGHIDTSSAPREYLETWKSPLAVSQLDMMLVQYFYIWMFWAFPKLFGIKNREEELKGVFHLWALYGRMVGIQDEYNVCIKPDFKLFELLNRNFVIESFKTLDDTAVTVTSTLIDSIRERVPFMTYKATLYIGLRELQGHEGDNLWNVMSWGDKVSFRFLQAWMWIARQNFVFRFLLDIPTVMWLMFHFRGDIYSAVYGLLTSIKTSIINKLSCMKQIFT